MRLFVWFKETSICISVTHDIYLKSLLVLAWDCSYASKKQASVSQWPMTLTLRFCWFWHEIVRILQRNKHLYLSDPWHLPSDYVGFGMRLFVCLKKPSICISVTHDIYLKILLFLAWDCSYDSKKQAYASQWPMTFTFRFCWFWHDIVRMIQRNWHMYLTHDMYPKLLLFLSWDGSYAPKK